MENTQQPEGKVINFAPIHETQAPVKLPVDLSEFTYAIALEGKVIGLKIPDGQEEQFMNAIAKILRENGCPAEVVTINLQ